MHVSVWACSTEYMHLKSSVETIQSTEVVATRSCEPPDIDVEKITQVLWKNNRRMPVQSSWAIYTSLYLLYIYNCVYVCVYTGGYDHASENALRPVNFVLPHASSGSQNQGLRFDGKCVYLME